MDTQRMKNKAKCYLCKDIIESKHSHDLQVCSCGHIMVDKGSAMKCAAGNWANFLRIDDEGNEIAVRVLEDTVEPCITVAPKPTREEMLDMLDAMASDLERLPTHAKMMPATNSDLEGLIVLLSALLRVRDEH